MAIQFLNNPKVGDNVKIEIGNSSDLQIYHNATDTYIDNQTGNLFIVNKADDKDIRFQTDNGAGGTTTYFTIDGLNGINQFSKNVSLPDNVIAKFGNSSDLQIYHDSNNSKITESGTGGLYISSNLLGIESGDHSETMAKFTADGSVDLYHNNVKKFETTSTGVTVTGNVNSSTISIDDYITHNGDTDTYFGFPAANEFKLVAGGSNKFAADANAAYMYYQGGVKFSTTSAGVSVTSQIIVKNPTGGNSQILLEDNSGSTQNASITFDQAGDNQLYITTGYDSPNDLNRIYFQPGGETAMTIRGGSNASGNAGNVGIGTTTPGDRLTVDGGNIRILSGNKLILNRANNGTNSEIYTDTTGKIILNSVNSEGIGVQNAGSTVLSVNSTGNATFAGAITLSGKVSGVTAGTANTDAVNFQQLTDAVTGVLVYQGVWDASGTGGGSPDLTAGDRKVPGYYWIVNVDGQAAPNGTGTTPNEWVTGDWCVFSDQDTDAWQKIDNTNILTGAGTGGTIAGWAGSGTSVTLGNTPITFAGTVLTTSGDINIGNSASLYLGDSGSATTGKAVFGAGNDLELYSNGTDGYVVATVDDLVLQSADDIFIYTQGGEDAIIAKGNAAVELYHNNTKKFETTSTGVNVAGNIVVNTTSNGNNVDNVVAEFGNDVGTTQSRDAWIKSRSSSGSTDKSWAFGSTQAGEFKFNYLGTRATAPTSGTTVLTIGSTGAATFAGEVEVINAGGLITGRSSSSSSTNSSLRFMGGAYTGNKATAILYDGVSGENQLYLGGGTGAGEPATNIRFHTGSAGATGAGTERMRITSSGNIGIGTTSPQQKLDTPNIIIGGSNIAASYRANAILMDNLGGVARFYSLGSDTSTGGSYQFNSLSSNATAGSGTILTLANNGNATFTGKVIVGKDSSNALEVFSSGDTEIGFSYATKGNIYAKIIGDITTASPLGGELAFQTATGGTLTERMRIKSTGQVQFNAYGLENFTGNVAYQLAVDSSGNIIEIGASDLPGGPYLPLSGGTLTGSLTVKAKGGQLGSTGYYVNSQFSDVIGGANVGVIIGHNDTTNGLGAVAGINGLAFLTYGTAWAERIRIIGSNGNVGINNSNPLFKLTVSHSDEDGLMLKTANTSNSLLNFADSDDNDVGQINYDHNTNHMGFRVNAGEKMRIDSSGNVGIGTTSPASLSANTFNLSLNSTRTDLSSALFLQANGTTKATFYWDTAGLNIQNSSGDTKFSAGGSERMRITSAGNVGIGTGGFAQKPLDVSGATGGQLLITSADDSVGSTAGILLRSEASEANGLARVKGGIFFERIAGTYGNGDLKFAVNTSANNNTVTVADTKMTIGSDGNTTFVGTVLSAGFLVGQTSQYSPTGGGGTLATFTGAGSNRQDIVVSNQTNNAAAAASLVLATHGHDFIIKGTSSAGGSILSLGFNTTPFLSLTSSSATFAGTIQSDDITIVDGTNDVNLYLANTSYGIQLDYSAGDMFFRTNNATRLTIANGGNATFAGVISAAGGNAAAPSIIFEGNTDTGFFHPATDEIGFSTAGSERMRITSAGNVGIGTTSPSYPLHIQSTTTALTSNLKLNKNSTTGDYAEIAFQLWSGAGASLNTFGGNGTSRPSVVLRAINENANSAAGAFVVATFAGGTTNATLTEKFRINSAGNVGIGTTAPDAKLSISKSSFSTTFTSADSYIRIGSGENAINGYQFIGFGYNNGSSDLVPAYIGYQQTGTPGNYTKGDLVFGTRNVTTNTAPTERMRITSAGKVGIGTTSPSEPLEVVGVISSADSGLQKSTFSNVGNDLVLVANAGKTNVSANLLFKSSVSGSTTTEKLRIDSSGAMQFGTGTNNAGFLDFDGTSVQINTQRNPNTGTFVDTGKSNASINLVGAVGASYIRFNTANGNNTTATERVRITGTGQVGIGTNDPSSLLHLSSASSPTLRIVDTTNGVTLLAFSQDSNAHVGTFSNTDLIFDTNSNERIRILNGGNVGIGTSAPAYKLEVSGGAISIKGNVAGTSLRFDSLVSGTATSRNALYVDTNNVFQIGNTNYASNNITGNTTFAGNITVGGGQILTPSGVNLALNPNTGVVNVGGVIRASGTANSYFTGNVGIGTTNPTQKLTVGGGAILQEGPTGGGNNTFQTWQYGTDTNYKLLLKQNVGGGIVKHIFDLTNSGTAYNNILVLDRGKVGIGTASPSEALEVSGTIKGTKLGMDQSGSSTSDLSAPDGFIDVVVGGTAYIIPYYTPE